MVSKSGFMTWVRTLEIEGCPPFSSGSIDDWEIELGIGGAQVHEQVERTVEGFRRVGGRNVHFIDHDDGEARARAIS